MTMRVAIVHNNQEKTLEIKTKLTELLENRGVIYDERNPELVISIGGDGTLLSAFHRFNHRLDEVKFLGVHTGHLGFYTDWRDYELNELVENLTADREKSVSYPLLDVELKTQDGNSQHFLALNESTIRRGSRTMVADVFIKDECFERFRGDGIAVSTPTGSTAYNKSVGGAIIHPSINAIQLAEIASLNNRVFRTLGSPLVVSENEWIELRLDKDANYQVTVDQLDIRRNNVKSIVYKIAKERIHFASYRHMHFWHRVKDAFISED